MAYSLLITRSLIFNYGYTLIDLTLLVNLIIINLLKRRSTD
ncbi:protein of unknown function [Latilactobacillus sakei]|nr:hypothetical protein LSAJ18_120062 [Latilactobacillus sakei]SON67173.1 protein of unknown function [Latilactobacillus sakei]